MLQWDGHGYWACQGEPQLLEWVTLIVMSIDSWGDHWREVKTTRTYSSVYSKKGKRSHSRYQPGADPSVQAVSPQVNISHPPGSRLPLLPARPAVTFPAAEHHRPWASTKLYCSVTEAHVWATCLRSSHCFAPRIWTHDLLIASPTL